MEKEDLSKLRIDKSVRTFRPAKRKKLIYFIVAIVLIIVAGFLYLNGIHFACRPSGDGKHFPDLSLPDHFPVKCEWLCGGPAKGCRGIQGHRPARFADGGRGESG